MNEQRDWVPELYSRPTEKISTSTLSVDRFFLQLTKQHKRLFYQLAYYVRMDGQPCLILFVELFDLTPRRGQRQKFRTVSANPTARLFPKYVPK